MAASQQSELRVGAGAERINPPLGVAMPFAYSGGGEPEAVAGRHDDCWARALVLEHGATRIALVSVDLCTMRDDQYQAILARIAARCGISAANVLVACTHNHSNNALLEPFAAPLSPWQEILNDLIVSAVCQAASAARPVARMRYATAKHAGVAYNRRVALPDAVCMLIGAEPHWEAIVDRLTGAMGATRAQLGMAGGPIAPQGVVDDSLRLLVFEGGDGANIASIVSAACHPVVHSFADRHTCADYPGLLVKQAERELGGTALFLQGCSGDVRPRYREPTYAEVMRVGRRIGSALQEAASRLADVGGPYVVSAAKRQVELPLKPYQTRDEQRSRLDELEQRLGTLAQMPAGGPREVKRRWAVYQENAFLRYQLKWGDLETRQADLERERVAVTLQAARLGEVLVLASPAEVFAETGLELTAWAREQGWAGSMIATCANGYVNYIPPRAEAERGGFEPSCTMLAPGACERMVGALKGLAREVAA